MKNGKFYAVWVVILIVGIVGILSFFSNSDLQKKIKIEEAGLELNNQFVEKFFNYTSSRQRYDSVKSLMTEQGYRATYPSGMELPADSSVRSLVTNHQSFVQKEPSLNDNQMEYLNRFVVTTEFNGIQSSKEVIMRTLLIKEGSVGWKVNDIEMIIQNTKP